MENTLNICIKENLISNSDHESDYESKISYIRSNEKIKTIRYPTPPNRKEIKV